MRKNKRILTFLMVVLLLAGLCIIAAAEQKAAFQASPGSVTAYGAPGSGDLNGNGKQDAGDLTILARFVAGRIQLTADQMLAANVDGSPGVGIGDLTVLARCVVHIANGGNFEGDIETPEL